MASLEADWLHLTFSTVGIMANTIFLFVSEMHNLNSFRPVDKQKNEHDFCIKLLDAAKKNGANSAFALKATEELKAQGGRRAVEASEVVPAASSCRCSCWRGAAEYDLLLLLRHTLL